MNTVWDRRASTTFAIRKFDDDRLCGGVLRRRGRTSRLQPAFHLSMVDQPGLLRYRTTAVEDDKVRYAANMETGRELRIALGVNLDNERAARLIRRAGNLRCRHLTRTTPCRPEIDQHRDSGVLRDFVELLGVHFERFVHRRRRGFTCSAPAGFSKMFRWNPI